MPEKKRKDKFTFKFVHPDGLRDLYINGAWGGTTPRSEIHMHLYSERQPIPEKVTHSIQTDGKVLKNGKAEFEGDIIRLVQASVIMDVNTAISLRDWLSRMIDAVKKTPKDKIRGEQANDD